MYNAVKTLAIIAASAATIAIGFGAHAEADHGLPDASPESVGMSAEALEKIPAQLQNFVDDGKLPGFVTVVARDGKVVHFNAMGMRDVERELPMTEDTIFRMYSMTKPITGVAIMILVDEGKLDVDDPVSKYLPEFSDPEVIVVKEDGSTELVPAERPMTIEHLLTHTSGLSYGGEDHVSALYRRHKVNSGRDGGLTLAEFSENAAKVPLLCQPGTEFNYGISMDILGRVVEVISGQSFGEFLEERIFQPLDMKDSGFHVPESEQDRFAANYGSDGDGGMRLIDDPKDSPYLSDPSIHSGGGGSVGTARDYLRFAQMLLNRGELDGVRIISEESADAMMTHQLDESLGDNALSSMLPMMTKGIGFGYTGAVVMDGYGRTLFGTPGTYSWGGAASTDFWIDTENKMIGMVLTQFMPTGTYPSRVIVHTASSNAIEN